nr:unnamed protein product [Digitaria exilis]
MANGLPDPPCGLLTADSARSLVDSVDAFLFDCDGVIWKGDKLIEGVSETMELLRKLVYVVGEDGILEELKLAGFECFGGPEDGKKNIKLEADFYFEHDKSAVLPYQSC